MTLYEINEKLMNCFFIPETEEVVDGETGEVFDSNYLDRLDMAREEKIEGIALWIKNIDAEAEAIKAEKMKLAKRQAAAEKRAENLRNYLLGNMGEEKFSTAKVAISFRHSQRVECDDVNSLPFEFVKTEIKPALAEIKKALKGGREINGCRLADATTLQIK